MSKVQTSFQLFSFFLTFLFLNFYFYTGNSHPAYANLYQYIFNPDYFQFDIYLENSLHLASSFFNDIVYIFRLNPDNDLIFFPINLFFSFIAFASLVFLLNSLFPKENILYLSSFIFPLLCFPNIFLDAVDGSIIYMHTRSPSFFCHILIFPLILFSLKNKWLVCTIILSIMMLLALKISWFPFVIFVIYFLIREENSIKKCWIFSPLIFPAIFLLNNSEPLDPSKMLMLTKHAISRGGSEDVLFLQNKEDLITLFLSFCIYFLFLNFLKDRGLKLFFSIVFYMSIFIALASGFYTSFFYEYFPDPRFIIISPVRALAFYNICFLLLLSINLIKLNFSPFSTSIILIGLTCIGFGLKDLLIGIPLILLGVIIEFRHFVFDKISLVTRERFEKVLVLFRKEYVFPTMIIFLAIMTTFLYVRNYPQHDYSLIKPLQKWNTKITDKSLISAAIKLRECGDFPLLAFAKDINNKTLYPVNFLNFLAKKSSYIDDSAHLFLNSKALSEHFNRERYVEAIQRAIKNHDESTLEQAMENSNVVLMLNVSETKFPLTNFHVIKLNKDIALFHSAKSQISALNQKGCK